MSLHRLWIAPLLGALMLGSAALAQEAPAPVPAQETPAATPATAPAAVETPPAASTGDAAASPEPAAPDGAPTASAEGAAAETPPAPAKPEPPKKPDDPLIKALAQECERKNGRWIGELSGSGRQECIMRLSDADRACKDAKDCLSGFCVVRKAKCDDQFIENPRGKGLDDCTFEATCHDLKEPPLGCHGFMEEGKFKSWCID